MNLCDIVYCELCYIYTNWLLKNIAYLNTFIHVYRNNPLYYGTYWRAKAYLFIFLFQNNKQNFRCFNSLTFSRIEISIRNQNFFTVRQKGDMCSQRLHNKATKNLDGSTVTHNYYSTFCSLSFSSAFLRWHLFCAKLRS